jgi:hypothetical protein
MVTRKYTIKIVIKPAHVWNWDRNEVEVCATNITNKTKCMSTNAKKWGEKNLCRLSTTSAICGVKT